jgi:hypothetical protein
LVSFLVTADLSPDNYYYDIISSWREYDYYRFTVPYNTYYLFSFDEYGVDVYGYLYVNGSQHTGFDDSAGYYFVQGSPFIMGLHTISRQISPLSPL